MSGQSVDTGDHFKKQAAIPLAPCTVGFYTERRGAARGLKRTGLKKLSKLHGWSTYFAFVRRL